MTVRVRLFAILRELAGRDSLDLELQEGATVADALQALAAEPSLAGVLERLPMRMAVNRDYATPQTELRTDDELALIPPVSGGSPERRARVLDEPLLIDPLSRAVADPGAGAIIVFQGVTREVARLDYEAYREMAVERIESILDEAVERHELRAAAADHRVGPVELGEPSVIVACSAAHREQAFAGAREIIDRIKAEAPIWKREVEADGSASWAQGSSPEPSWPDHAPALTHIDERGRARMVDVGAKPVTERRALARARVRMSPGSARAVLQADGPKGEVLGVARFAGVQAAKRTGELIPLAHPLGLTFVDVTATVDVEAGLVELHGEARASGRTGVEMEAMTACAVAALTVYDMVKGIERGIEIEGVVLLEKTGGRSDWRRPLEREG